MQILGEEINDIGLSGLLINPTGWLCITIFIAL